MNTATYTPVLDSHANTISPERVGELTRELGVVLGQSVSEITDLNREAGMLSLNARIEAARAGELGAAFGVVADAMAKLSTRTSEIAGSMSKTTRGILSELEKVNESLSKNNRGARLSDLALTNIELIDRNLYERSCDVRWWATDSAIVSALEDPTPANQAYASRRMGVILDSYTVYFDLVLCDLEGNVVANGRPERFSSRGTNHGAEKWFQSAMATKRGDEFGFQSGHRSSLVNHAPALIYSCSVRRGGEVNGVPLGALGIVFNWNALGQTIVENVPLGADEKEKSRSCIVDPAGFILADSAKQSLVGQLKWECLPELFSQKKNFLIAEMDGKQQCIGHAYSPGFETYATGWHSLVMVELL